MSNTLSVLKTTVKWCPICGGAGKDPNTGGFSISQTEIKSTPMSECSYCQEARALIKQLEAKELLR